MDYGAQLDGIRVHRAEHQPTSHRTPLDRAVGVTRVAAEAFTLVPEMLIQVQQLHPRPPNPSQPPVSLLTCTNHSDHRPWQEIRPGSVHTVECHELPPIILAKSSSVPFHRASHVHLANHVRGHPLRNAQRARTAQGPLVLARARVPRRTGRHTCASPYVRGVPPPVRAEEHKGVGGGAPSLRRDGTPTGGSITTRGAGAGPGAR